VTGVKGSIPDDALLACGLSRGDQYQINRTGEAGIGAGLWNRPTADPNCEQRRRRERRDGAFGELSS
jgi:hypothetical protein